MELDLVPALDLVRAFREQPDHPVIRLELTRRVERDGGWWCVGDAIYTVEDDELVITPVIRDPDRKFPSKLQRGKYLDTLPRGRPKGKTYRQSRMRR